MPKSGVASIGASNDTGDTRISDDPLDVTTTLLISSDPSFASVTELAESADDDGCECTIDTIKARVGDIAATIMGNKHKASKIS